MPLIIEKQNNAFVLFNPYNVGTNSNYKGKSQKTQIVHSVVVRLWIRNGKGDNLLNDAL